MDAIDKINFYLSKKGKNGADLSRALGLSNSIYSQWNTRKTKPSNVRLPAIAEYLGVSVEDIMPDDVAAPAASEGTKKAPESAKKEPAPLDELLPGYALLTEENKLKAQEYIALLLNSQRNP